MSLKLGGKDKSQWFAHKCGSTPKNGKLSRNTCRFEASILIFHNFAILLRKETNHSRTCRNSILSCKIRPKEVSRVSVEQYGGCLFTIR